jgi:cell division protein FtsB
MFKSWIRKYFFSIFLSSFTLLICSFFMAHIFFGDRSLWKIFELNKEISIVNKELDHLLGYKNEISSEIDLLRGDNVDTDLISEISQKMLGLIQPDQIVIKIPK